ncbi:MAG: HypC/HybG/HupF family hydrogenase formation chaperone [Myxococcaceae bacterium]
MCLGIPGELVSTREENGLRFGLVRFGGITRDVCLECMPQAAVGDYLLVHVGFAISKIDPEQAKRALETLAELGLDDELEAAAGTEEVG